MRRFLLVLSMAFAAQAADQTLSLKVDGWHSKGDAYKTEQAVQKVKGVKRASSDLTNKSLTVVFDDGATNAGDIQKAIVDAGYVSHR